MTENKYLADGPLVVAIDSSTTIAFVDVVEESIATTRGPSARYLFSVMMLLPHL